MFAVIGFGAGENEPLQVHQTLGHMIIESGPSWFTKHRKNSLNEGRVIKPDSTLKAIFPVSSIDMLKMPGYVSAGLRCS